MCHLIMLADFYNVVMEANYLKFGYNHIKGEDMYQRQLKCLKSLPWSLGILADASRARRMAKKKTYMNG